MESPSAYIPMDRRQAIARNESLQNRTTGAALFADISGFTPLTEALLKAYGPKRGPEELTRQLNLIYDALVAEVHRFDGSVIAFSGDAITCWLDGDNGLKATACGLAMQDTMSQFAAIEIPGIGTTPLAMKAAVATGPVRRFLVGDPSIQVIDVLAGATLDRMATAEHQANKGEVVIAPEVAAQIADQVIITERRQDHNKGDRFAVVTQLSSSTQLLKPTKNPPPVQELSQDLSRPWLLPPVYDQLSAGKGDFLAELRPATALFLSFSGIDYDDDEEAGDKLNSYIQWIQNILVQYDGYMLQLTIGDKGSYLYSVFGAPVAHEDDALRAVSAALELQTVPATLNFIDNVEIGISLGQMRAGAYGGTRRRTYGVLGDEVNLAARLMQAAQPGQILVKDTVQKGAGNAFRWQALPPLKVKGKSEPVNVFSVEGQRGYQAIHLQEQSYVLPMVGRKAELDIIDDKLNQLLAGQGQIIGITAEAGMGKSRLVAEVIRLANHHQITGYGGECQSYGTNISYLVWQSIWQGMFGLDSGLDVADQIIALEKQLEQINPTLAPRLPLLGSVLNLTIPDNDLTRSFDAKLRKTSLESLLVDCLRERAKYAPLMLVLEDSHWLDPLSMDLLEIIGRAIVDLPALLVLVYRPSTLEHLQTPKIEQLDHFLEIQLTDFTPEEAEQLIDLKLTQFFGEHATVSSAFQEHIIARAQGNPFYIEELLNYLQSQKFDPTDSETLDRLDLPTSLHSLILTRIDQLTEQQKSTLKVASIIGRLFEATWLWGMYPDLGDPETIKNDLEMLNHLDLVPMDKPEPVLTYIFKHIVTQEVAYESLPYATRARLHGQLGLYIENKYSDRLDRFINLLAYHYDHSKNEAKKREYLRKAGESAQAEYANKAAVDYYQRVLPLLSSKEKISVMRQLGEVEQLIGQWAEADNLYNQALALAEELGDTSAQAWCQIALGTLFRLQGQYLTASEWLKKALTTFDEAGDQTGVGQVLHIEGTLAAQQGDLGGARSRWAESLEIRQLLEDKPSIAALISNLGIVAHYQSDFDKAKELHKESLALRYDIGDKLKIANSLNNLGNLYLDEDDYLAAQTQLEVALGLQREIGDRWAIANALNNLANVLRAQGDYEAAETMYEESLTTNWELGDKWAIAYLLEDIGGLAALQDQPERALYLVGAAATLRENINSPLPPAVQEKLTHLLEPVRQALGEAAATVAEAEGKAMSLDEAISEALKTA